MVRDGKGRAEAVRYDLLASLLVNELQRQEGELEVLSRDRALLQNQLLGLWLLSGLLILVTLLRHRGSHASAGSPTGGLLVPNRPL